MWLGFVIGAILMAAAWWYSGRTSEVIDEENKITALGTDTERAGECIFTVWAVALHRAPVQIEISVIAPYLYPLSRLIMISAIRNGTRFDLGSFAEDYAGDPQRSAMKAALFAGSELMMQVVGKPVCQAHIMDKPVDLKRFFELEELPESKPVKITRYVSWGFLASLVVTINDDGLLELRGKSLIAAAAGWQAINSVKSAAQVAGFECEQNGGALRFTSHSAETIYKWLGEIAQRVRVVDVLLDSAVADGEAA